MMEGMDVKPFEIEKGELVRVRHPDHPDRTYLVIDVQREVEVDEVLGPIDTGSTTLSLLGDPENR